MYRECTLNLKAPTKTASKNVVCLSRLLQIFDNTIIYLYLKRTAHLAINASLPCVPLKHIYIYTQVKHMIKHRICQV